MKRIVAPLRTETDTAHSPQPQEGWVLNTNPPYITLDYQVRPGYVYDVPLADLRDPQGRERWLNHLMDKSWFEPFEFKMVVLKALGISEY